MKHNFGCLLTQEDTVYEVSTLPIRGDHKDFRQPPVHGNTDINMNMLPYTSHDYEHAGPMSSKDYEIMDIRPGSQRRSSRCKTEIVDCSSSINYDNIVHKRGSGGRSSKVERNTSLEDDSYIDLRRSSSDVKYANRLRKLSTTGASGVRHSMNDLEGKSSEIPKRNSKLSSSERGPKRDSRKSPNISRALSRSGDCIAGETPYYLVGHPVGKSSSMHTQDTSGTTNDDPQYQSFTCKEPSGTPTGEAPNSSQQTNPVDTRLSQRTNKGNALFSHCDKLLSTGDEPNSSGSFCLENSILGWQNPQFMYSDVDVLPESHT